MQKKTEKNQPNEQYRITTLLTAGEKAALKKRAWKSGRTMSSYIRYLVVEDSDNDDDD